MSRAGRMHGGGIHIEFLRVFADRCHHTKEETLLFPAMLTAAILSAEETITVLLQEHGEARAAVVAIAGSAQRLAGGDTTSAADLAAEVTAYTSLLRSHIGREESDCFNLADPGLPASVKDELIEGYDRIERDVVGEGRHEAFHALLDSLAEKYIA